LAASFKDFKLETVLVGGSLIGISALSWFLSTYPIEAGMMMSEMFSLDAAMIILFSLSWTLGMIAMMFPVIVPITLTVFRAARNADESTKEGGGPTIPKAFTFAFSYVLLWIGFGIALYILIGSLLAMSNTLQFQSPYFRFLSALIVLGAGIYQFAPFKGTCLNRCHPTTFLVRNYRGGMKGSAMMGISYGFFCVGCCWALMIILLLIGSMSLVWMGIFAFAILVERTTPARWQVSKILGTLLLILGAFLTYQSV